MSSEESQDAWIYNLEDLEDSLKQAEERVRRIEESLRIAKKAVRQLEAALKDIKGHNEGLQ